MIIDLRHISHEPRRFDFTFQPHWWQSEGVDDQILGPDGLLTVRITIYREGRSYTVEGNLEGRFKVRCDRCLEPYTLELQPNFRLVLDRGPLDYGQSEYGLMQEDLSVRFIDDPELNVDEIVREQIYLSLPIKCLCREDCAGLCPVCGRNLNLDTCSCQRETGHPAFSKLKDLRLDKD
ncbi:MAG: DUF177 domain-containing protein [Desulfatiglandaceae bacterium]